MAKSVALPRAGNLKRHLAILEPDLEMEFRKQQSLERGLAQSIRVNTERVRIQDATYREKE